MHTYFLINVNLLQLLYAVGTTNAWGCYHTTSGAYKHDGSSPFASKNTFRRKFWNELSLKLSTETDRWIPTHPLIECRRPFFMLDSFVYRLQTYTWYIFFLSSYNSFCPVKRGNRAGSSRNDYSRTGTQIFIVSRVSRAAVARISD